MTDIELRSNSDLLDELRRRIDEDRTRYRVHVHPDAAIWINISTYNTGLSIHAAVVADPAVTEVGRGWLEIITPKQWRKLQALVGHRVHMDTADQGRLTGVLVELDDEAVLDVAADDRRYLRWARITPATD